MHHASCKPSWKLACNSAWWLCLDCCPVLPTRSEATVAFKLRHVFYLLRDAAAQRRPELQLSPLAAVDASPDASAVAGALSSGPAVKLLAAIRASQLDVPKVTAAAVDTAPFSASPLALSLPPEPAKGTTARAKDFVQRCVPSAEASGGLP